MNYKDWYELRNKNDKTEQEKLLLELKKAIVIISEILVSYDKGNYSEEAVINEIRETINEITHKL